MTVEHLAQQPLADAAADFGVTRQTPGEFNHAMIDQRHARFERKAMLARSNLVRTSSGRYVVVSASCMRSTRPGSEVSSPLLWGSATPGISSDGSQWLTSWR